MSRDYMDDKSRQVKTSDLFWYLSDGDSSVLHEKLEGPQKNEGAMEAMLRIRREVREQGYRK